jgi:hypothetical protein
MELDNKKLTILLIVTIVFLILDITFTVYAYIKIRNKTGPRGPKGSRGPRGVPGPPR